MCEIEEEFIEDADIRKYEERGLPHVENTLSMPPVKPPKEPTKTNDELIIDALNTTNFLLSEIIDLIRNRF